MKRMTILYVLEFYYPYIGGSEKLFTQLAESMAQKGHTIHVLTSCFQKDLPLKDFNNGVHIHRIKTSNRYTFTLSAFRAILKLPHSFDLIHTTTYNAAVPSWLASRFNRIPVILTFHEVWGKLWFKLPFTPMILKVLFYLYESMVLKLPYQHYIAVSDYTKQSLVKSGIPPNKISLIYNGIDYSVLQKYPHNPPTTPPLELLFFGRLGISKGLDLIIDAMAILSHEHIDYKLTLVIPTAPRPILKKIVARINKKGVTSKITILHSLEKTDLYRKIQSSHVVLIPSYSEGFCFAAVETAAIGTPIVHSNRGALREVLSEKGSFPMKDQNAKSLAASIKSASKNYGIGPESHPLWPISQCVRSYMDLYETIKTKKGGH